MWLFVVRTCCLGCARRNRFGRLQISSDFPSRQNHEPACNGPVSGVRVRLCDRSRIAVCRMEERPHTYARPRIWCRITATFEYLPGESSLNRSRGSSMTNRKLLIFVASVILVLLCQARPSLAQTTTSGGLAGVVLDPSNAVVPGATVELQDITKGTIHTAWTAKGFTNFSSWRRENTR